MRESLYVIAMLSLFAFFHSLPATERAKRLAAARWGEKRVRSYYRFMYCLVSTVVTAALFLFLLEVPDVVLFSPLPRCALS